MTEPHSRTDPQPDRSLALQPHAAAPSERPEISELLDRYDIAMILTAAYEWGGYRYSNASDAIAAAKRAESPRGSL